MIRQICILLTWLFMLQPVTMPATVIYSENFGQTVGTALTANPPNYSIIDTWTVQTNAGWGSTAAYSNPVGWGAALYKGATFSSTNYFEYYGKVAGGRGILVWHIDNVNIALSTGCYIFSVIPNTQTVLDKDWVAGVGSTTRLVDAGAKAVADNNNYYMKVIQTGTSIKCYLSDNGTTWTKVIDTTDPSYSTGRSGLQTSSGTIYYDNIAVDDGTPSPTPTFTASPTMTPVPRNVGLRVGGDMHLLLAH